MRGMRLRLTGTMPITTRRHSNYKPGHFRLSLSPVRAHPCKYK